MLLTSLRATVVFISRAEIIQFVVVVVIKTAEHCLVNIRACEILGWTSSHKKCGIS